LKDFTRHTDEAGLAHEHELSRAAMEDGVELLEVVQTHHRATQTIVSAATNINVIVKTLAAAGAFLIEALSPFEMSFQASADRPSTTSPPLRDAVRTDRTQSSGIYRREIAG
jgi:phosphoserine phosphatase RsbU-like protein